MLRVGTTIGKGAYLRLRGEVSTTTRTHRRRRTHFPQLRYRLRSPHPRRSGAVFADAPDPNPLTLAAAGLAALEEIYGRDEEETEALLDALVSASWPTADAQNQ
jgi:hypothetical protein